MGFTPCILVARIKHVLEMQVVSFFMGRRRFLGKFCPHQPRSLTHEHSGYSGFQYRCMYVHTFIYVYI